MIRDAVHADIPQIMVWARQFAEAIGMADTIGFDEPSVEALLGQLIDADGGILLITEGGAAGGIVHPSPFNNSHLTGQELFWWLDPEQRGGGIRLFIALENAATARGAASWMVSTMDALNFDGASRFYERRGYRASDRNFIKTFGG